jgi:hypothetical protein
MKKALLTIAVACALAGCGSSGGRSDRDDVEGTIEQYFHAAAFGDGDAACSFLSAQARHGFEALLDGSASQDCETNVRRVARRSLALHNTRIIRLVTNDDRATAYVVSDQPAYEQTIDLVRHSGSWRLLYLPVQIRSRQPPRVTAHGHH